MSFIEEISDNLYIFSLSGDFECDQEERRNIKDNRYIYIGVR